MKRILTFIVGLVTGCMHVDPAHIDDEEAQLRGGTSALRVWNDLALDAVRTARASDADAARAYAMVNVAMFDAVNGLLGRGHVRRESALVPPVGAPAVANFAAAVDGAAYAVLTVLFPDQAARFDAQIAADKRALGQRAGVAAGLTWGNSVGTKVVDARTNDGARPVETVPPGSGPGIFRAAWSNAQFRNLAPFAIADAGAFVSPPPPALTSAEYATAFAEIKIVGNAAVSDPEALARFQFWNLPAGTDQPAGEWLKIALEVSEARHVQFFDEVRLLALVTMALSDVVAPTFSSKFVYAHWRPATAINEADTDGNPLTDADPTWKPRAGGIGANPQHTSGHSAFSAAAATVLAGFFGRDDIAFTHLNDGAPNGMPRPYTSFSAAMFEAGRSRVEGGLHFEFSNQAGLAAGRGVGTEVIATALLRKIGPR